MEQKNKRSFDWSLTWMCMWMELRSSHAAQTRRSVMSSGSPPGNAMRMKFSAASHPKHTQPARRKPWKKNCVVRASKHPHSWRLSEPTRLSGISTPRTLTLPYFSTCSTNIFICRFCWGHSSGNEVSSAASVRFCTCIWIHKVRF